MNPTNTWKVAALLVAFLLFAMFLVVRDVVPPSSPSWPATAVNWTIPTATVATSFRDPLADLLYQQHMKSTHQTHSASASDFDGDESSSAPEALGRSRYCHPLSSSKVHMDSVTCGVTGKAGLLNTSTPTGRKEESPGSDKMVSGWAEIYCIREGLCRIQEAMDRRIEDLVFKSVLCSGKRGAASSRSSSDAGKCKKEVHLSFVTGSYSIIALNWIASLERLGIENYLLVCLDSESYSTITANGKTCLQNDENKMGHLSKVWLVRWVSLYHTLVEYEVDVVLSDVDAVWLQSPNFAGEYDIISSQGTFPWDTYSKWGTTLCMGVIFFRNTHRTLQIISQLIWEMATISSDDQRSMNHLLERLEFEPWNISSFDKSKFQVLLNSAGQGVMDQEKEDDVKEKENATAATPIEKWGFTKRNPVILIGLISKKLMVRNCETDFESESLQPPVTLHCLTSKNAQSKQRSLQKHHIWFLK